MRRDVTVDVIGRWPGVLRALGVDEAFLRNKHGPCPLCGGKDRYRFDDKDGKGTWFCSHCGAGSGFDLLMRLKGIEFKKAAGMVREVVGGIEASQAKKPKDVEDTLRLCRSIWDEAKVIVRGDPVDCYLRNRGVGLDEYPSALRYHSRLCYERNAHYPAMLALVRAGGKVVGVHRTYLQDGKKAPVDAPRKLLGTEGLIPLARHEGTLGVAEGIETALAAAKRFAIPCWSTINAGGMERMRIPDGVRRLHVFADHDASFTGQRAAYALAYRAHEQKVEVHVHLPSQIGDWADVRTDAEVVCAGV